MLYNLLYALHDKVGWFNVFRYITFRSIGAAITAFLILCLLAPKFIRWLQAKQIGQVVRSDGPESHLSKQGVPTMGGILILVAMTISTLLWADLTSGLVWLLIGISLFFGGIGAIDDLQKVTKGNSKGLPPRGKLMLQVTGASIVGLYLFLHPEYDGRLAIPFFKGF